MSTFTEHDHVRLATLFEPQCPDVLLGMAPCKAGACNRRLYDGYKPTVREAPNGDMKACPACKGTGANQDPTLTNTLSCVPCNGVGSVPNVDDGRAAKRWLHVAPKYNPPGWAMQYYDRAFAEACRVATALGVPAAYRPHEAYGALRVLEYPSAACVNRANNNRAGTCGACGHVITGGRERVCPALAPGAGTVEHKDPDLFTIVLWRSTPADLELSGRYDSTRIQAGRAVNAGLHIGEIGELVGLGPATPHRVPARPYVQKSIVYFAIPDWAARLPGNDAIVTPSGFAVATVGEWLADAMARRRYETRP